MAALITGANGFVGKFLIDFLLKNTDKNIIAACWGIDELPNDQKRVSYHKFNLTDFKATQEFIKTHKPSAIFHLASQSSVRDSMENPLNTFNVNILGSLHLFESVRLHSPASKILTVGSGEVYGTHDTPVKRETDVLLPISPYASSKAAVDLIAYQYFISFHTKILRTRSYSHTGPYQEEKFVLSSFAKKLCLIKYKNKEPVIYTGNIDVERDFLDVRDVVRAYYLIMEKEHFGEVYNVCSGKASPLRWILERMIQIIGINVEIRLDSSLERRSDNPVLVGDYAKLKLETGWEPRIPLDQTLADLIDFWKNRILA